MRKKNKQVIFYIISFTLLFLICYLVFFNNKLEETSKKKFIELDLITSVHPDLPWKFNVEKNKVNLEIGKVITINYNVKNLSKKTNSGVAAFSYYPKYLGKYFNKINCFCYDLQTLKPGEEKQYSLVLFVDPKATKEIIEKKPEKVILQFTFFSKNEFKKIKN